MPIGLGKITSCLWYDSQAEEAARFYVSVFENAKLGRIARYGTEGREIHGREAGSVMTVEFELEGQSFVALNGGPHFTFSEAISFQILCDTQAEIDHFWTRLSEGGQRGRCGWLKDRFGLSWQVTPRALGTMLADADSARVQRVTAAFLQMGKYDLAELVRAFDGEAS